MLQIAPLAVLLSLALSKLFGVVSSSLSLSRRSFVTVVLLPPPSNRWTLLGLLPSTRVNVGVFGLYYCCMSVSTALQPARLDSGRSENCLIMRVSYPVESACKEPSLNLLRLNINGG